MYLNIRKWLTVEIVVYLLIYTHVRQFENISPHRSESLKFSEVRFPHTVDLES